MSIPYVEEFQGLYGPFSISEKIIQKIWFQGDFYQGALRTASGKTLTILKPGRWNMNEGPDFREAQLMIEGEEIVGDVEVHFEAQDWFHHGHDQNPNFSNVVLHVVLYEGDRPQLQSEPAETLVLMPLLERDLEEYAMDAALLDLEQVNELEWFEPFMDKPLPERCNLLVELSALRWQQKSGFAAKRLGRADWSTCCHQSVLEVLGYSRNRTVMHKVASHYAIVDFADSSDADSIYHQFDGDWRLSGCRPANHPKLRLKQYAQICSADSNWPGQLLDILRNSPQIELENAAEFRKAARTKELLSVISEQVFQGVIGSKRLNTLLCDAVFPLAHNVLGEGWQHCWQHWYPGDYPDAFSRFYRKAGLADTPVPMSNGMLQGILVLFASRGDLLE